MTFFFSPFIYKCNWRKKDKPSENLKCWEYLELINNCKYICISHGVSKTKAQQKWEKKERKKNHCIQDVMFSK